MRSWTWVGLAVTACIVLAAAVGVGGAPATAPVPAPSTAPAPAPPSAVARPALREALEVLSEWDERRAAAWRSADAAAVRDLYPPGSSAAAADVALLRRYERAGWRVERLQTQLLAVRLLRAGESRLVLRVRDRVSGGVLLRDDVRRPLPASAPATRTLTLVGGDGSWRVARARPSA